MSKAPAINRRNFLKVSAVAGGGLLIAISIPTVVERFAAGSSHGEMIPINAFLRISEDNHIHIILSKIEMGQGIWTTLPMLIAEELDCDWNKINVEHHPSGKGDDFNAPKFEQGTGGSSSTISQFDDKQIIVHRVVCAIDCGLAVNPDGVHAQMEGCIVFGLTAALYGEITLEKGLVQQSNFNDYRMLRMNEMPEIEVYIVPSSEKMGGAGEPGVPPIAPAVANAVFAATGKRIRRLPIEKELLKS